MALDYVALGVGLAGLVIVLGVLLMKKSAVTKVSGVVPLMLLGMLIGPITGFFDPTPYLPAISTVVTFILVIVLFDVGYDLSLDDLKKGAGPALGLGFLAAALTGLASGALAYYLFDVSWKLAMLFAALVISTDLTIVEPLIAPLRVKEKHKQILSLESAMNSIIAAVLAIVAVNLIRLESFGAEAVLKTFLYSVLVGAAFGIIFGFIIVFAIKKLDLEDKPHIISIGAVLLVYAVTNLVGASGIMAALLVGIVFRNSGQRLPKIIKSYSGDLEILFVVFIYVILGTLFNFKIFESLATVLISLGFIAVILLTRWISAWLFTKSYKEMDRNLIFYSGPRGTVTAVLALSYAAFFAGIDIIGIVFLMILATTIITSAIPFMRMKAKPAKKKAK